MTPSRSDGLIADRDTGESSPIAEGLVQSTIAGDRARSTIAAGDEESGPLGVFSDCGFAFGLVVTVGARYLPLPVRHPF